MLATSFGWSRLGILTWLELVESRPSLNGLARKS